MKLKTHWVQNIRPVELALLIKKITGNKRIVLNHGKFKFYLDVWSNLYWNLFNTQLEEIIYEQSWTEFITNFLSPGKTFIDLGANEGWFSIYAASKVGKKGRVFSIEPQKRLAEVIQVNATLNNFENIIICNNAITMNPEDIFITLSPSLNTGSSSFIKTNRSFFWKKQKTTSKTLDDIVREHNLNSIELIKIDIEGYELFALKSGEELLRKKIIKNILIDFHENQLNNLGTSTKEIKSYLTALGYIQKRYNNVDYFSSEIEHSSRPI
ncbi:FkbM family methyltransferase [Pedobacter sp.]|uniref:FkbM family methyltransferase n=1 Tax=Pedobacter sp. TaxID=1411316 RepID=UPI003BA93974